MTHLRPKQYYINLYDKHTVDICRRWLLKEDDAEYVTKKAKEINASEEDARRALVGVRRMAIYFQTGERYIKKEETIREWMERDKARDEFYESAKAPEDIPCLTCGRLMFTREKSFHLGGFTKDDPDRVLFFYECPLEHLPRRAFYNNGEEFKRERPHCAKCDTPYNEETEVTEDDFITTSTCPSCGHVEVDKMERSKPQEEVPDPNYESDRAEFCLSEEKGREFIDFKHRMEGLAEIMDKVKEKEENKETYDEVAKLKKLKITELEELLTPILEKEGYVKLHFKDPEISKDVFLPFVVYDAKAERTDRESTHELEKLLRKALKETNWRLVTGGASYRLGMLEGRLHGYEREEDLVRLVQKNSKGEKLKQVPDNGDSE